MTKKRFFKLRQALVTELYIKSKKEGYDAEKLRKAALCTNRMPQPILKNCGGSYDGAWEMLKPLRKALKFQ